MRRKIVLLISAIIACSFACGQEKVSDYKLPYKIDRTINRICCECNYDVWTPLDKRFYYFKYMKNGEEYNVTIDSSGYWIRTYQEVNFDSIPKSCREVFVQQLNKYESEYKFDELLLINHRTVENKKYELQNVLIEFNEQNLPAFYDFRIQKPILKVDIFSDTVLHLDMKSIKINLDCELLNDDVKIIKRIDGQPLLGYVYFANDPSSYNSSTVTIEYSNGKKNGLYIQYFNYPDNIASVGYYLNDKPVGPFYYYHRNGKIKQTGVIENGQGKIIDQWFFDGTPFLKYTDIANTDKLFKDKAKQLLNGKYVLRDQEVYFSNGKIDSTVYDQGKHIGYYPNYVAYHQNYIDSTRTLSFYDEAGFIKEVRIIKMTNYNITISDFEGFAMLNENCMFENEIYNIIYYEKSDFVKEKGAYRNFKKIGKWYYYDKIGNLVNEEDYSH